MADIDRLLRSTLQERADIAPDPLGLLGAVHARSRRLRRRRRTALAAGLAAAALALGVPLAVTAVDRDGAPPRPGSATTVASSPSVAAPQPSVTSGSPQPLDSPTAGAPGPATPRVSASAHRPPTFPFQLGSADAPAYRAPVVTVEGGILSSYNEARDPVGGADITLLVTERRPEFTSAAGPVTEVSRRVRGRSGFLRTVAISPAAEITVYWQESATQWVALRTDDTFTEGEVIRFANQLVPADLPVVAP